jgi:hypothetical protein
VTLIKEKLEGRNGGVWRVKADLMSKTQERLGVTTKAVTEARGVQGSHEARAYDLGDAARSRASWTQA